MTLPIDTQLPFRPSQISEGGQQLTEYMRDLVNDLQDNYQDMVDNVDGQLIDYTPVITGSAVSGTGTYTLLIGKSLRQGIRTTVFFNVSWSLHTGNGDLIISLPYKVRSFNSSNNVFTGTVSTNLIVYPAGTSYASVLGIRDALAAKIICSGSGVSSAYAQLPAAGSITGQIFYIGYENE